MEASLLYCDLDVESSYFQEEGDVPAHQTVSVVGSLTVG